MVLYICSPCNYTTKNRSDFKKHENRQKHMQNSQACILNKSYKKLSLLKSIETAISIQRDSTRFNETEKIFTCKFCNIELKTTTNYNRHLKTCIQRKDQMEKDKLEHKLLEKEKELKKSEKQVQKLENDKNYYRGLIDNLSTLGPKNFNSVTYILNNYAEAPHIKAIEPKKLKQFKDLDDTKVENVLSYYRNNLLYDHIIEAIIYIHKKDDPSQQSVWL